VKTTTELSCRGLRPTELGTAAKSHRLELVNDKKDNQVFFVERITVDSLSSHLSKIYHFYWTSCVSMSQNKIISSTIPPPLIKTDLAPHQKSDILRQPETNKEVEAELGP